MTDLSPVLRRFIVPVTATAVALMLASCAVGPTYRRPDQQVPEGFKHAASGEQATPEIKDDWWTLFGDPQLNRLAGELLNENLDIKAAMARVDEARAATREAKGAFFPTLSLDPSVRRAYSATTLGGGGPVTTYSLPLDLSYEVDIWGRLRRQYEYYKNTEQASADDLEFVRQTALADLAQGYFSLRLYDDEAKILKEAQDLYSRQLDLTSKKQKAGLAPQTDVLDAQNQLDSARNQLIEIERLRAKQEDALAILLGKAPSDFTPDPVVTPPVIPVIPSGLPASILARRPDVAEAEAKLKAANAQVGVAEADFYPTLTLTGSAGFESFNLRTLTNWQNRLWSVGPGLSLPIFQGGKLTAALAGAQATYREVAVGYRQSVLGAFRDVEDELVDLHSLKREADSLEQTLKSARENVRLTELQYRQGLSSYLDVIVANQTQLTNELSAASVQNQRMTATVLLIKALGGGWKP